MSKHYESKLKHKTQHAIEAIKPRVRNELRNNAYDKENDVIVLNSADISKQAWLLAVFAVFAAYKYNELQFLFLLLLLAVNISMAAAGYVPIQHTEQAPYKCVDNTVMTGQSDLNYNTVATCAAQCATLEACTHFMLRWNTGTTAYDTNPCCLVHLCNQRTSASSSWDIWELNRILNDSVNYVVEDVAWNKSDAVWSKSRRYRLWYDSTTLAFKFTNALASTTIWSYTLSASDWNVKMDNGILVAWQASTGAWEYIPTNCIVDAGAQPHYLYVMDYAQLVMKNVNGAITCVIGYDDTNAIEVPYTGNSYSSSCSGIGALSENAASTADYALFGVSVASSIIGLVGPIGGLVATGLNIFYTSWAMFGGTDSGGTELVDGIMGCVIAYVDYRIDIMGQTVLQNVMANFKAKVIDLIGDMELCDFLECHLTKWEDSNDHELTASAATNFLTTTYPRSALPIIANLMTIRLQHYAYIYELMGCTDSDCMVTYIKTYDTLLQKLKATMWTFRQDNGKLIDLYLSQIAATWYDIMTATDISTQQKNEEIQSIWMNGAVCRLWIPRTYDMSQKFDSCASPCSSGSDYVYSNSYTFESSGSDFSAYVSSAGTQDLTSGYYGDDCVAIIYDWIASQYTASTSYTLSWESLTELGDFDRQKYNMYKSDTDGNYMSYDRCLAAPESTGACISCDTSTGNYEFLSSVAVKSYVPDVSGWQTKNSISDGIMDSFPLIKDITGTICKNVEYGTDSFTESSVTADELQFFNRENNDECWGTSTEWVINAESTWATCPNTDEIAVGISFYRASEWSLGDAGYLLWKMRLQCMSVAYPESSMQFYEFDTWTTSSLMGNHYSDSAGGGGSGAQYEYEGWTSFYQCAPKYAITGICATTGWVSNGGKPKAWVQYGVSVTCTKWDYEPVPILRFDSSSNSLDSTNKIWQSVGALTGSEYDISLDEYPVTLDYGVGGGVWESVCFTPRLNDADDCVKLNYDIGPSAHAQLSMELYLYQYTTEPLSTFTSPGWIMSSDNGGYDRSIIMHDARFAPSGYTFGLALGVGDMYVGSSPISNNAWTHIVATWDEYQNTAILYVDGVQMSSTTTSNDDGNAYVCLNQNPDYVGHGWKGCISKVAIYDRVLSATQAIELRDEVNIYTIKSYGINLCLDVDVWDMDNNGAEIQIWECNGEIQQQWIYDLDSYAIKSASGNNKCLDVHSGDYYAQNDGGLVHSWECNGQVNQQWFVTKVSDSKFRLKTANGMCLDVYDQDYIAQYNGGLVQIYTCGAASLSANNQFWDISSETQSIPFTPNGPLHDHDTDFFPTKMVMEVLAAFIIGATFFSAVMVVYQHCYWKKKQYSKVNVWSESETEEEQM